MKIPDIVQGAITVALALVIGLGVYITVRNNDDAGFLGIIESDSNRNGDGPAATPEITEEPSEPVATDLPTEAPTSEPQPETTEEPAAATTETPTEDPDLETETPVATTEPSETEPETVDPEASPTESATEAAPLETAEPSATDASNEGAFIVPNITLMRYAAPDRDTVHQEDESSSATPLGVDANLVVQWLLLIGILVGVTFAVRKDFTSHRNTMTFLVIVNWFSILGRMTPNVEFYLEAEDPTYSTPIIMLHAAIGLTIALFASYLVIRMWFEKVLPEAVMIKNIKLWMRITATVWIINILIGTFMYFDIYG